MPEHEDTLVTQHVRETVDAIYRSRSRHIFATLIRLLGDFDVAEEALHDAFRLALEQWSREGVPVNPQAWLVSTGRFKAIDGIRRRARFEPLPDDMEERLAADGGDELDGEGLEDDRLRLIFTCCHPALPPDAQVALTLREVCGLTTEEIAHAFLTAAPTLAQRIVRAKAKIRDAHIPYQVPSRIELPDRLDSVLRVVYLVFNEGYSASSGEALMRSDLSGEAIPLRQTVDRIVAGARSAGAPRADAAPGIAARRAQRARRRSDSAGRPKSFALESGLHRGRINAGGTSAVVAPVRSVHGYKPRSLPCTPTHPTPRRRTGLRSPGSMIYCCAPILRL